MAGALLQDESINNKFPQTVDELIILVESYNKTPQVEDIRRAFEFSKKAHEGQVRRSGEPYIFHPLGVAAILAELKLDIPTIITGLLHDTVEDTEVSEGDIKSEFGDVVTHLVDGVTKISKMKFRHTHEKQGENIRKMIVAMGQDVRVILVKLADRLHNMRTLNHMPPDKQVHIAQETLDIYAPLASRLGISSVKVELEDLSFRYSMPERYYELAQKVDKKKKEREKYISEVKKILTDMIQKNAQFKFEVQGRPKHLYSIYKKMQTRAVDYDQVYDVLAFRVCLESISECYEALGIVHSLWKPIPGRFKDFIAMPKANNYQSLHTAVIGPGGERIEIQIRTHEMHLTAERGIAAHWKYKEASRGEAPVADTTINKFNWLRELVSLHQKTHSSDELLENVKVDLAESEIYVFTPKGEVREFPDGATPIDFAYAIHTDIGHRIVAARIDGRLVSLRYLLQNGDTVEVITSKNQTPSKDWLKYCATSRAKSKIRAFITAEQRKRAMDLGREILEKSFRREGYVLSKVFKGADFDKLLKDLGCSSKEDLFVRVGYGRSTAENIIETLIPERNKKKETQEEEGESFLKKAFKSAAKKKKSDSLIKVDGMDDILIRFSKCCNPIPGDPILGFITFGRGITIHRADCGKAFALDQARRVDVGWNQKGSHEFARVVRLRVLSNDVPGLLKLMTEAFSSHGVNILNAQIRTTRDKKAICIFDIEVHDTTHLSETITALQKLKGIIEVARIKGD